MSSDINRARSILARALENFKRFELGTYGHRDAVHKDIPNALEVLIEAKFAALIEDAFEGNGKEKAS